MKRTYQPSKEKEETSMDFAPENQVWAVVPCSGVDGKRTKALSFIKTVVLKSLPGQIIKRIFLVFIKGYQIIISPLVGPSCRFHPTCSNYAVEAIEKKSLFVATYLIIVRLLRCNPFFKGGEDPVR